MDWTSVNCSIIAEASSAEEGVVLIEALRPDIVITDIRMQGMSGIEMLKKTLAIYPHHAIILSGYAEFSHAQEAIRLGVVEYLLKPIDFEELKNCILRITSQDTKSKLDARKEVMDSVKSLAVPKESDMQNEYARKMLAYITEHYAEKISIMDLSEAYEVSSTHLNAKFKAETGYTFHDFLNYYRISKAVELQKEGKWKMYEIAEMVGISDYKYFNKVYKKYVGYAPAKLFEEMDKQKSE
ncbi:MAG: response regulator [Solobacterium sp.]|nr:response regulator [Solobacterium sp.]